MKSSGFIHVLVAFLISAIVIFAGFVFLSNKNVLHAPVSTPESVACTMDAKLCPDGSSVVRVAPSCDFAPCPDVNTSNWKKYSSDNLSFQYPSNLFIYTYPSPSNTVAISDIKNPTDIPAKISPEGHTIISISFIQGQMPNSFPYTNGSDKNNTIKSYSINNYVGIRGQAGSTIGISDEVLLKKDNSHYISIVREIGSIETFDQVLSTFKFTDSSSSHGDFCGGIAGVACPAGYSCKLSGSYPDASGTCQKS